MIPFIEHSGKSTTINPWLPGDEGRKKGQLWRVKENLGGWWKCSTSWFLQHCMVKRWIVLCANLPQLTWHSRLPKNTFPRDSDGHAAGFRITGLPPRRQMPSFDGFDGFGSAVTSHQSPRGGVGVGNGAFKTAGAQSDPSLTPVWSQATLAPLVQGVTWATGCGQLTRTWSPAWELLF